MKWFRRKPKPVKYIEVTLNGSRVLYIPIDALEAGQAFAKVPAFFDVYNSGRVAVKLVVMSK